MVTLTGLAIALTGLVAYLLQVASIDRAVNEDLRLRTTSFQDLASKPDPATGEPYASAADLIRTGIQGVIASETESAVGHVNGVARFVPGGEDRLELYEDTAFLSYVSDNASTTVTVQSLRTDESDYRFVAVPLVDPSGQVVGTFTVATDRGALVGDLNRTYGVFALAGLVSLALVGAVAWVTVGRLLQPIRLLDEAARDIGETDLARRIPIVGNDDLARLSETVNAMLDRLEGAFSAQRQLLDDAGHELRTPLSIMRTNLELLEPRDADQVVETQALLLDEIAMMSRLVDDLVILAKADRPEFVNMERTDLADLTDATFARAQTFGERTWTLETRGEGVFAGDQQRLIQAWMQLVANAVKFSDQDTVVALGSAREGRDVRLWVRDKGRGIPAGQQRHVLERFHRVDNAIEGAGLGLPIVAAIAAAHGGSVELKSVVNKGSLFTIVIPAGKAAA